MVRHRSSRRQRRAQVGFRILGALFRRRSITINGMTIDCTDASHDSYESPAGTRTHWPVRLVFGKSRVRVYYWNAVEPNSGNTVKVADRIEYRVRMPDKEAIRRKFHAATEKKP